MVGRRRTARRGQSIIEFGLVAALVVVVFVTVLDMMPVFSVRSTVFEIAAATVETATEYKAPTSASAAQQRSWLCEQLAAQTYDLLRAARLPTGGRNAGCSTGFGGSRWWVNATTLDSFAGSPSNGSWDITGSQGPVSVRVCLGYRWVPNAGLFWFFTKGFELDAERAPRMDFRFCGRGTIDPRQSR